MRKSIFFLFIILGASVGYVSAANETWGTQIVMMGVGVLFAAPIGGLCASIGKRPRRHSRKAGGTVWEESPLPGYTMSPKDLAANYWRDKGHPPFSKPSEAEPDKHQFDPDKIV